MSEAKFRLTAVCGCGWASDQPRAACVNCGQAICPQCGNHALAVAAWPGESQRVLLGRARMHARDMLEQALLSVCESDEGDAVGHRH